MKAVILKLIFVGCLTSGALVAAAPASGSSHAMNDALWKAWRSSKTEPKRYTSKKVEKSIFVFPTFKPDCGDGYEANMSGKCVKIVTIDENEQIKINLNVLNRRFAYLFGKSSEEVVSDSNGVAQRFHIQIPVLRLDDYEDSDSVEETTLIPYRRPPVDTSENELVPVEHLRPPNAGTSTSQISTTPEYLKMKFKYKNQKYSELQQTDRSKKSTTLIELNKIS